MKHSDANRKTGKLGSDGGREKGTPVDGSKATGFRESGNMEGRSSHVTQGASEGNKAVRWQHGV